MPSAPVPKPFGDPFARSAFEERVGGAPRDGVNVERSRTGGVPSPVQRAGAR